MFGKDGRTSLDVLPTRGVCRMVTQLLARTSIAISKPESLSSLKMLMMSNAPEVRA